MSMLGGSFLRYADVMGEGGRTGIRLEVPGPDRTAVGPGACTGGRYNRGDGRSFALVRRGNCEDSTALYVVNEHACKARWLYRGVWGHVPPGKFWISGLLRSLLVRFWGITAPVAIVA